MFNRKNEIIKKLKEELKDTKEELKETKEELKDTNCTGGQLQKYYDMEMKIATGYYEKASDKSSYVNNSWLVLKEIFNLLNLNGVLEDFYANEYNLSLEQKMTKMYVELGAKLEKRKESITLFEIPGSYGKNKFTNYVRYLLNNGDLALGEKEIDINTNVYYAIKNLVLYEKTGEEKHLMDAKTFIDMKIKELES